MINIYKILITILFTFLVLSCQKQNISEEMSSETTVQKDDETEFNPLDLPRDKEIIPLKYPKQGDITGQMAIVDVEDESTEDSIYFEPVYVQKEIDSLNSQTYRIQIFAGKVYGEAKYALRIANEIFDRPVLLDYEVPYYKVRVGSFSNKDKAEEYLMRVKTAGYTNAWVVTVIVNVKESAPLYEDYINSENPDTFFFDDEKYNEE
ncbi:MAG: SPOR domain-containing protein [Candidatus Zixiibacteriota bacterium]